MCEVLSYVTIENGVTSIGEAAFNTCALQEIIIPDSVTTIGGNAFAGCPSLTSVTIKKESSLTENSDQYPWGIEDPNIIIFEK